jgi:N-acetyl-anhydromuramyl-L-alanine amidase AmpD
MLSVLSAPEIVPWLLPNEEKRQELTRLYLAEHCGEPCQKKGQYSVEMEPKIVVVHWTAGSTAKSAWYTFSAATLRGRKSIAGAGSLNVSSQYLIDRDGTIYELLPPTRISRHCIGLNHLSIGIENVGDGKKYPITKPQIEANIALIRHLKSLFPITHLIGHHEHNLMRSHVYFRELDPKYKSFKPDPGNAVMEEIRFGLLDLKLEGVPQESVPK